MTIKTIFFRAVLFFILALAVVGALIFWMTDPLYLKAPKDRELIRIFQEHHAAFEKLRHMVVEDSVSYLTESHMDGRLNDARKHEYQSLLLEISSGLIFVGSDLKSVRFIFAGGGLSAIGPGWIKGIEYVPGSVDRAGEIQDNLDQPSSLAEEGVYLRQIEPTWFIVFQKDD